TLHAIEAGGNPTAEVAEALSTALVRFHLRTMERLGIEYDFLPRESEILRLHFWDAAFRQLKEKSVICLETRGAKAGAVDLILDPNNPRVLYAAFWEVHRTPYSLESGGPGSGLFKSTDGGETWKELSRKPGMPKGLLGKIGIAVSAVNSERLWVIVEAEDGGVFRSENGGDTWTRVNENRNLRQRAWYYSHIYADPLKPDTVYVLNTGFYKSDDGGKSYSRIGAPHGDHHDLWIDPRNPRRMINGNDGGANVSSNGGRTWSAQDQPTAQFYRVALDQDFPYNIYGAQQDNSTVRIASRTTSGSIAIRDWYDVGGGESGWIAPHPRDSNVVFAGSYGGYLTRHDHRTGQLRSVNVWPENPMGAGAADLKYRFQWNFPILFSPHEANLLYAAANVLFQSTDEGQSWRPISGDLTRNDKSRQGPSGGPITKDNTSVEYYGTIFTVAESPLAKGLIWTGSDDGLVYVTRDGGKKWENVTPREMPEWIQINSIEASPHEAGAAYVAATMYKSDDFRPYLYRTADYGKTWRKIVEGIPANAFTRVIREDPNRRGLLYAGTETGMYVSFDDGEHWQSLQLNLPVTPVTDLALHKREKDLVAATQGRSFWVLDDLAVLHQMTDAVRAAEVHLFAPEDAYRLPGGGFGGSRGGGAVGQNPPSGAVVYFWLKDKPAGEVTVEFLDAKGAPVRRISTKDTPPPRDGDADEEEEGPRLPPARLAAEAGLNRFVWDLRYPEAKRFPGMILWAGNLRGPLVVPGAYQVKVTVDGKSQTQSFTVKKDPRIPTTPEQFSKQLALLLQLRDKLTETHEAIVRIRDVRKQVDDLATRAKDRKAVAEAAQSLAKKLTAIEDELYQTRNRSSQDPLNYPIRLNNKLASLAGVVASADAEPTSQSYLVHEELAGKINEQLRRLKSALGDDLEKFNRLVRDEKVPAVSVR
ncbi:MAG: glycosyl hydrolase, partial [Candidatus Solibacter usitatus]|nr:glycosyl hydrolase [Candidatus Solibacter usitatus]